MTNKQMADDVALRVRQMKIYVGKQNRSTFYTQLRRIRQGCCKARTVAAFAARYGYEGTLNNWHFPETHKTLKTT